MNAIRNQKILLLLPALLIVLLAGCEADTTAPIDNSEPAEAPVLPNADALNLDLSFFDAGADGSKASRWNFFNAYLRAVVVSAMTHIVLAPPVAAFSVALHSIPSLQEDGSWIWVYTHVDGQEELQIRLRGLAVSNGVQWEMRVSSSGAGAPIENELWFEGTTRDDGRFGDWTFYDFNLAGDPAVSRVQWSDGEYVILSGLYGQHAGDVLEYHDNGVENSIDFTEGTTDNQWYIRWNDRDGSGSLMVPDFNNGEPACWDENQEDTVCP